jgi:hypothetical protein
MIIASLKHTLLTPFSFVKWAVAIVFIFTHLNSNGNATDSIKIRFNFLNVQQSISNDSVFSTQANDIVRISKLKFYISNCRFKYQYGWSTTDPTIHLIDFNTPYSNCFTLSATNIFPDSIRYDIGIDSAGNTLGAQSGSTDPVNGMYWTWQSGFINTKIEGSIKHESFTRDFQYHIGGYAYPNNTLQTCQLPLTKSAETSINIDLVEFFNSKDATVGNQLMSPGPKAVQLSKQFSKCFHIQQP